MKRTAMALAAIVIVTISAFLIQLYIIERQLGAEAQMLLSLRLTVVGFAVTFAGFVIAIFQIIKAVNAAEAAQTSVKKLKENLGSYDIVGTIGSAKATVQEGLGHLAASRWEALLGSFSRLNTNLSELIVAPSWMETDRIELAKELKSSVMDACTALRNPPQNDDTEGKGLDIEILDKNLKDAEHFLISLAANMKDRVNG